MHILLRFLLAHFAKCGEASVRNAVIIEWMLCDFVRFEVDANYLLIESIAFIDVNWMCVWCRWVSFVIYFEFFGVNGFNKQYVMRLPILIGGYWWNMVCDMTLGQGGVTPRLNHFCNFMRVDIPEYNKNHFMEYFYETLM